MKLLLRRLVGMFLTLIVVTGGAQSITTIVSLAVTNAALGASLAQAQLAAPLAVSTASVQVGFHFGKLPPAVLLTTRTPRSLR